MAVITRRGGQIILGEKVLNLSAIEESLEICCGRGSPALVFHRGVDSVGSSDRVPLLVWRSVVPPCTSLRSATTFQCNVQRIRVRLAVT